MRKAAIRLDYIDASKGIGMLLVIWAHTSNIFSSFIYAFHMPLFFFLSGMMFREQKYQKIGDLIKKRMHTLIIPYLFYSFVTWIVWSGYTILTSGDKFSVKSLCYPLLQTFIAQGSGGFLIHNVPLWFVTCLFIVEIVYFFTNKLPEFFNFLISLGMTALGYTLITKVHFFDFKLLPWNIEVAFVAIIFYTVGNITIKHFSHDKIIRICGSHKSISILVATVTGIVTCIGSKYTGRLSLGSDVLNGGIIYYIDAFCGILMILIISILLTSSSWSFPFIDKIKWIIDKIKWIGEYSFRVMALHNPIRGFIAVLIAKSAHETISYVANSFYYSIIVFLITLTMVIPSVWFITKLVTYEKSKGKSLAI